MRTRLLLSLLALVSALLPVYAAADTILPIDLSPGLSGWHLLYTPTFFSCGASPGICFQGNLGLAEILDLPAGTYSFSFLAKTTNFHPPADIFFYVWWRDALVKPSLTEQVGDYTRVTYSGLISPGGNTGLVLGFSSGCGCLKWNIPLPPPPPNNVPEPATLVLMATGIGASLTRARKRRRRIHLE